MKNSKFSFSINDENIYSIIDHVHASIYFKNLKGIYLGCNRYMLQMLNVNDRSLVIGETDYDLSWSDKAEEITRNDKIAIKNGTYSIEESFINDKREHRVYLTEKSRLLDDNGKIIGVMGTSVDITSQKEADALKLQNIHNQDRLAIMQIFHKSIDDIFNILHKNQIHALRKKIASPKVGQDSSHLDNIKLTRREQEIIYSLSVGKSPKEIANILAAIDNKEVSFKTVLSIINKKLYPKFEVFSVSDLVDSARLLGLIPFLPNELYPSGA
jgi:DNA-binding NarL/FixJ family response regulator